MSKTIVALLAFFMMLLAAQAGPGRGNRENVKSIIDRLDENDIQLIQLVYIDIFRDNRARVLAMVSSQQTEGQEAEWKYHHLQVFDPSITPEILSVEPLAIRCNNGGKDNPVGGFVERWCDTGGGSNVSMDLYSGLSGSLQYTGFTVNTRCSQIPVDSPLRQEPNPKICDNLIP